MKSEIGQMNTLKLASYFSTVQTERQLAWKAEKDLSSLDSLLNHIGDMHVARASLKVLSNALKDRQDVLRDAENDCVTELVHRNQS